VFKVRWMRAAIRRGRGGAHTAVVGETRTPLVVRAAIRAAKGL